ncbi:polysaccharide deacetylase family protein [Trichothermofontia sichuanensis B231]|uniref:polysaccharide deacetylase family protein n=1 Tax=Trichothermofontia sichuanensis TaxID=3045816 RepID=UPI0022482FF0|nr:polysaccharide deacetylase family protein [Trichothermofontia sichuanensis]UZQ55734.1 polysaccharide deacetylase family protein [Trichothermofontia sichuanensis B231]
MHFAPFYGPLYRILSPCFPQCLWAGSPHHPLVALTFDDGPHPSYTPDLLAVLDHYQVQASFFWLGACVARSPHVARQVYVKQHGIGLHGYSHRLFPRLGVMGLRQELQETQRQIAIACDLAPHWVQAHIRDVRPPNGVFTPQTLALLQSWQYRPVMWSVVPEDWTEPDVAIICDRILNQVENGSLIVLHDGHYGGRQVAQVANQIIPLLQQRGFTFATLEQLWQQRLNSPIALYASSNAQ